MAKKKQRQAAAVSKASVIRDYIRYHPEASDRDVFLALKGKYPDLFGQEIDIGRRYVCTTRQMNGIPIYTERTIINNKTVVELDKKKGEINWREFAEHAKERQNLHNKASFSQDSSYPKIKTSLSKIILLPLADLHIGAIGTNYELFTDFTDFILDNENVFVCLLGDVTDNFVNFRNVLAMHQQIFSPEQQDEIFESWLKDIKHKVLFSTWGNHEEFEERYTGRNIIKRILKHNVTYFNGMAQVTLKINNTTYILGVTHKTRYWSEYNRTHGIKRMLRENFPAADIGMAGDRHSPDVESYIEAGKKKTAIQLGTLKVDDGYTKRYFSYFTSSIMPCIVFDTRDKKFTTLWTIQEALDYASK